MPIEFRRKNQIIISSTDDLTRVGDEVGTLITEYQQLESKVKSIKVALYDAMTKFDIKKWETLNGTQITCIPEKEPTKKMELDVEMLKNKHPKIYKECLKEVESGYRSGYVRITPPKEEIWTK